jgi:hypothetical protein
MDHDDPCFTMHVLQSLVDLLREIIGLDSIVSLDDIKNIKLSLDRIV